MPLTPPNHSLNPTSYPFFLLVPVPDILPPPSHSHTASSPYPLLVHLLVPLPLHHFLFLLLPLPSPLPSPHPFLLPLPLPHYLLLGQYEEEFKRSEINGYNLLCMDEPRMVPMNISHPLHRAKIMSHVSQLRQVSTHLLNMPYQPTLSAHPTNIPSPPPYQPTLSTRPINTQFSTPITHAITHTFPPPAGVESFGYDRPTPAIRRLERCAGPPPSLSSVNIYPLTLAFVCMLCRWQDGCLFIMDVLQ